MKDKIKASEHQTIFTMIVVPQIPKLNVHSLSFKALLNSNINGKI